MNVKILLISGLNGICQNLWECNYALSYRRKPGFCDDSTVCCPPFPLRISEKMCFNYFHNINYLFDVERSTSAEKDIGVDGVQPDNVLVAVGTKTVLRKSSHMAAIGFVEDNNKIIWGCGGSIISPFFILSASHCVEKKYFGSAKWVRIRNLDLLELYSTVDVNQQDFRIIQYFKHPDYVSSTHYNDIVLFKLDKEIIFGDDYQPACLNTAKNVPGVMEVTTWGQIGDYDNLSSYYLQKKLNVIEYEICSRKYRDNRKLPNGVMDKLQICAWNVSGRNICQDAFGGPLQYKIEGFENVREHYVVAGIVSFGEECDFDYSTGVFTRVSAYLDWIEEIVWENEIEPETVTFIFSN